MQAQAIAAFLLLIAMPALAASPDNHAVYNRDGTMAAYTDSVSGITLRISKNKLQITAVDPNGKKLWSRANYKELNVAIFGEPARPTRPAQIFSFAPLPSGKFGEFDRREAHRHGVQDPVLNVQLSAATCLDAWAYISEKNGKLVYSGCN